MDLPPSPGANEGGNQDGPVILPEPSPEMGPSGGDVPSSDLPLPQGNNGYHRRKRDTTNRKFEGTAVFKRKKREANTVRCECEIRD